MTDPGNPNDPSQWAQQGWGAPPPGYGQQPQQWGQQQWGAQQPAWGQPGYGSHIPQNDGKAVAALVCAVVGYTGCIFVPAVVALVLARQADRSIQRSGGRLTGEGLVSAARIIAWIHIALCVVGFLFILLAVASVEPA